MGWLWVYRILFLPVFLAMAPAWLVHMWRRGGYGRGFLQRLGFLPRFPGRFPGKKKLWIHGVSVGEVQSLEPLVGRLLADGCHEIILTSTSSTGLAVARNLYGKNCTVAAFPIDFWPFSRLAWGRVCPDMLIHADGDLWPEHLHNARRRRVPVVIVNARLSERSCRRCGKFPSIAHWLWGPVSTIFSSGPRSTAHLLAIGVDPKKIFSVGNMKCDRPLLPPLSTADRRQLLLELGVVPTDKNGRPTPILFGCSTWPGEEEMLLFVYDLLRKADDRWRLLLVPRHGERRESLRRSLDLRNYCSHFRSGGIANISDAAVAVVDTVGELAHFIRLGTVAFLGKTLPPNGGAQSPLDAVAAGIPLVSGPNIGNFRDILEDLAKCNAVAVEKNEDAVGRKILELCGTADARNSMVRSATAWLLKNSGTADRLGNYIAAAVSGNASGDLFNFS